MIIVEIVFGFLIGASCGSFLSCAAWRLPRGYALTGRSICPQCDRQLDDFDNIPLVGYLRLKGKSSCCDNPIGSRYFLLELLFAIIGSLIAVFAGLVALFLLLLAMIVVSLLISLTTERRPVTSSSERKLQERGKGGAERER